MILCQYPGLDVELQGTTPDKLLFLIGDKTLCVKKTDLKLHVTPVPHKFPAKVSVIRLSQIGDTITQCQLSRQ